MLGEWEPANWIALAGSIIAPTAALAGAWGNGALARRARAEERLERWRVDAAAALGPMVGLLLDAGPSLVLGGQLRVYTNPELDQVVVDKVDAAFDHSLEVGEEELRLQVGRSVRSA